jgi:hypothetical protein
VPGCSSIWIWFEGQEGIVQITPLTFTSIELQLWIG